MTELMGNKFETYALKYLSRTALFQLMQTPTETIAHYAHLAVLSIVYNT